MTTATVDRTRPAPAEPWEAPGKFWKLTRPLSQAFLTLQYSSEYLHGRAGIERQVAAHPPAGKAGHHVG